MIGLRGACFRSQTIGHGPKLKQDGIRCHPAAREEDDEKVRLYLKKAFCVPF
jgi:hypothetical protein